MTVNQRLAAAGAALAMLVVLVSGVASSAVGAKPVACRGNGAKACPTPTTTTTTGGTPSSTTTPTTTSTTSTTTPQPTTSTATLTTSTTSSGTTSTTTTPSTAPSSTSSTSCTPQWTSSARFGTWDTNGYLVNNNMWDAGAGPQTISACAWNRWSIVSNQPGTGTDDGVKTYPDTQRHVSYPLSSLASLPSTFEVTVPPGGGTVPARGKQWNAAYDLWLNDFGIEVMVWNTWTMNWQYWFGVYGGQDVAIDGVTYHAWVKSDRSGIWFVRAEVTDRGSVDLGHLLAWAVGKGWLKSTDVLSEVEYGFEVAYTGEPTTFVLNDYSLALP